MLFSAVQKTVWVLLLPPLRARYRPHEFAGFIRQIILTLDYGFMLYAIVLLIFYTAEYQMRYQASQIKSSQLETRLAEAQVRALKMQLHPHFLFNTLNSISTLIQKDPEAAETMIVLLSELLRTSIENTGAELVPLSQEIQFLERYLEIEQIRFEDRLCVRFEIDRNTLDVEVPNLILQVLHEKLLLQIIDGGVAMRPEGPAGPTGSGVG